MPVQQRPGSLSGGAGFVLSSLFVNQPDILVKPDIGIGGLATDSYMAVANIPPAVPAWKIGVNSELLTVAAAATSTTASATLLPANSLILAVSHRVTVTIPTATSFALTVAAQTARFSTGNALSAGSTGVGILQWGGAVTTLPLGPSQAAAAAIVLQITGTNPATNAGRVRIWVSYITFTAPPI